MNPPGRLLPVPVILLVSCAGHVSPPVPVALHPPPPLLISEALSDDAELCVLRNPWRESQYVCLTVGELRRLIRGRAVARREATP